MGEIGAEIRRTQAVDGCKARQLTEVLGKEIKKGSKITPICGNGVRGRAPLAGKPAGPQANRRAQIVGG
jgi:hypothetical protein